MLLISMLLEMNTLVIIFTLMYLACNTGRDPGKPQPWVGMSLSRVSVGMVMSGMACQGDMSGDSVA